MPNMSYCQFRNTEGDFRQCLDAIGNAESIEDFSQSEQNSAENLYEMAKDYVNWYEQLLDQEVEDEDC
ncbi:hypothetical protein vBKpMFBKp34_128 [Klebsiella phage vB_KpM_FBKp34]|nr:hypothetical protein vBKpMFBKp34_128 [Klebsiella phage vB_KpM_FBKp34]